MVAYGRAYLVDAGGLNRNVFVLRQALGPVVRAGLGVTDGLGQHQAQLSLRLRRFPRGFRFLPVCHRHHVGMPQAEVNARRMGHRSCNHRQLCSTLRIPERFHCYSRIRRPYPTLALFVVPVLVLEPAKPVAAYLTATGHVVSGLTVLGVAELLKLVLIERLFRISRDKLMSIPAFAWGYDKFQQARNWVESLDAWQLMRRLSLIARHAVRSYFLEIKMSRKRQRLSWQER